MKMGEGQRVVEIVVVPFPDGQGHINPILQFSKSLALKGVKVTLLHILNTHETNNNKKHKKVVVGGESMEIDIEYMPRVAYNGDLESEPMAESYMQRIKTSICFHLRNLICQRESSKSPIACVVYDSLIPWVLDVANRFGLHGAPFFTESCAVNAIFYHLNRGWLKMCDIVMAHQTPISLPTLPLLQFSDFPSFVQDVHQYPVFLNSMIHQFSNNPRWMFINTFQDLEPQVLEWMQSYIPLKTVGPTVPSILKGKGLKNDHNYASMDVVKSTEDEKIIKWLDSKQKNSLVYVSFGSVTKLEEEQIEELAWGLKAANIAFLWVIKEEEAQNKLPKSFLEEIKEMGNGMVVKWCSQVEVLAHKSVGCFVTHCGWNSVLEAITCRVPMVSMPQWTDQMTNAKFVEDVWKVGVRVSRKKNGIFGREEIELCIRKVMEGEKSIEIRENAIKWMKLAAEDQTSDNNIDDFVAQLKSHNT